MENQLRLKDLYLGNIDAKNELINNSQEEIKRFEESFLIPENIVLDDFLNLKRYFIVGLKGTGKTALLRYLALKANEKEDTYSTFILFKSGFTEEDRKDFARVANGIIIDSKDIPDERDFEEIWLWFFHRHIVRTIVSQNLKIFKKDKAWKKYVACVLAPTVNEKDFGINKYFPKLKRGTVEIGIGFLKASTKLGLDFEFQDISKTKAKFNYIVRKANELFNELSPDNGKLYIMLDELELSLTTTKLYRRDAEIIRDLIIAMEKLNTISKKNGFNISAIGAVRSEVLTAVTSLGKEINKVTIQVALTRLHIFPRSEEKLDIK